MFSPDDQICHISILGKKQKKTFKKILIKIPPFPPSKLPSFMASLATAPTTLPALMASWKIKSNNFIIQLDKLGVEEPADLLDLEPTDIDDFLLKMVKVATVVERNRFRKGIKAMVAAAADRAPQQHMKSLSKTEQGCATPGCVSKGYMVQKNGKCVKCNSDNKAAASKGQVAVVVEDVTLLNMEFEGFDSSLPNRGGWFERFVNTSGKSERCQLVCSLLGLFALYCCWVGFGVRALVNSHPVVKECNDWFLWVTVLVSVIVLPFSLVAFLDEMRTRQRCDCLRLFIYLVVNATLLVMNFVALLQKGQNDCSYNDHHKLFSASAWYALDSYIVLSLILIAIFLVIGTASILIS